MSRILITGITGYIGSNLARQLAREHKVYGLVRLPLRTEYISDFQTEIRLLPFDGSYESVEHALREARPELVYHLAAYYTGAHGAVDTPKLIVSNITLGAYILEAMATCESRALVCATTVMTHYQGTGYCPLNLYAATKQAFSDLLFYYTDAGLLRAVTLMLSDTYGPSDRRPKVLNLARKAAETGERLALSDGGQDYDLVFIDDVVRAFQMAGEQLLQERWANETFQVCSEAPLSLRETVERMLLINGLTLNAEWGARPAPPREMKKAVRSYPPLPGWRPQIDLDKGLRRFYTNLL